VPVAGAFKEGLLAASIGLRRGRWSCSRNLYVRWNSCNASTPACLRPTAEEQAATARCFSFLFGALPGGISGSDCRVDRSRRWPSSNRRQGSHVPAPLRIKDRLA
jgi:hypothetical protein